MGHLDGHAAFVTGAGSGIGRGIAVRLAREGADVCVVDIDRDGADETAELVRGEGRQALVLKANAASQSQLEEAAECCVDGLGAIDISVANAGIGRGGSILEMPLKDWQDQIDVNLTGVFLTVQSTARRMVERGRGGRIVCISSLAAERVGAMSWAYSATKVAVRMLVRGWAQELGAHGITVNAIGPGVIDTPLAHALAGGEGGPIRQALEKRTPAGRVGTPADIGGVVAFLCGPDATFITGDYLLVDGGLRDAMGAGFADDPDDPRTQEAMRIMVEGAARREKIQKLLDER